MKIFTVARLLEHVDLYYLKNLCALISLKPIPVKNMSDRMTDLYYSKNVSNYTIDLYDIYSNISLTRTTEICVLC